MKNKKFELTDLSVYWYGFTLYRIKALKDFSDVKKGDIGGWIEKEDNLSQDGNCWVYNDAKVYDDTKVFDNARVFDDAIVHGNAIIYGNARVSDHAQVFGHAKVYGHALVCDKAKILYDAKVFNNAKVGNNAEIDGNAVIKSINDYVIFDDCCCRGRYITWTKSNNMWCVSYFNGTGDKFIEKGYNESKEIGRKYEAMVEYTKGLNTLKQTFIGKIINLFREK